MHDAHSIRKICNFFKKRKCARKVFIVFVTLSDFNKTSNRAATRASEPEPRSRAFSPEPEQHLKFRRSRTWSRSQMFIEQLQLQSFF